MDEFKYYYPVRIDQQLDFEGRVHNIVRYEEGHIMHSGHLMCGKRVEIKSKKRNNYKVLAHRENNKKLCPVCEEKWKAHPSSAWYKFVSGQAIKSAPLPALVEMKNV